LRIAAAVLSLAAFVLVAAAPAGSRKPSTGTDWTRTVAARPSGGYRMGNPQAKVQLVEYGSMTCPHCRAFDEEGVDPLLKTYVKTGKVSYEFRNYVRDPFDLTASLITRCNGAKSFFRLTRELLKDQPDWIAKIQAAPRKQLEALEKLPPNRMFVETARLAGLQKWAAVRGVPVAKSRQCLSNKDEISRLVQMTGDATKQYPDFRGTPTFVINGTMLDKTATWDALEPQLRKAVGG
jgi:protein-disulfide isomerase